MLWIDAVTMPVADPAAAALELERRHGLGAVVESGVVVVPLGGAYLELVPGTGPRRWAVGTDASLADGAESPRFGLAREALASTDPDLPAIVRWRDPLASPARWRAVHPVTPFGIRYLEVGGTAGALRAWLGPEVDDLPIRFRAGRAGVGRIVLAGTGGDVIIDELLRVGAAP